MTKFNKPYKVCPDCGAHLDPNEQCDCGTPQWLVAAEMPDGNLVESKARGSLIEISEAYDKKGVQIMKLERIA